MEVVCQVNDFWEGKNPDDLSNLKRQYVELINSSGEVPTMTTEAGGNVRESEIVAEYLDSVGSTDTPKLVPQDPMQAAHMRLAMKTFNDVVGAGYGVLFNKDPAQDEEKHAALKA